MLKTPLYDAQVATGGKMVEFAGWLLPVMYSSIVEEHQAVRNGCGLFDVSHMGRLKISGTDATRLLNQVCTRQLKDAAVGKCSYSLMCNETGGVLDDLIVTRFENYWGVVCNASNREKIVAWLRTQAGGMSVKIDDVTLDTVMVALQGPKTWELAKRLMPFELPDLKKWHAASGSFMFVPYTIYRSGYTGEDGMEVVLSKMIAGMAWKQLANFEQNGSRPVRPVGLGARDTLRIEAGLPLYGHELTETLDPLSAGLGWAVSLDKDFVGAEALRRIQQSGPRRKLVGLQVEGQRIARAGTMLQLGDKTVGEVTSGTFGPTVNANISMGYVEAAHAVPGTTLVADIRGNKTDIVVVELPFYKREKSELRSQKSGEGIQS